MTAPIAVQLFSLREETKHNFREVIRRLAEIGYVGLEPCMGLPEGMDETTKAQTFKEFGLEVCSIHAPAPLGNDERAVLAAAQTYNTKRIVLAYYDAKAFESVEGIQKACDFLNQCNDAARKNGLEFGYHNHNAEFQMVEGQPAYIHMLEYLDPTVFIEVDTYWAQVGGQNPIEVVRGLGSPLLHIKDGPADSRQSPHLPVGEGVMDIRGIVEAGQAHTEWVIVEIDNCNSDMMTAIQKSYTYLVESGLARGNN